jgi:hypothetical protein
MIVFMNAHSSVEHLSEAPGGGHERVREEQEHADRRMVEASGQCERRWYCPGRSKLKKRIVKSLLY